MTTTTQPSDNALSPAVCGCSSSCRCAATCRTTDGACGPHCTCQA